MKIGVTGHLSLDAPARERVANTVLAQLPPLLKVANCDHVEILSGLAPGADLVLTEALIQVLESRKLPWSLKALLIGEPDDIVQHWLSRAAELGHRPSEDAELRVRNAMQTLLQHAETCQMLADDADLTAFQQLAVRLATESDLLIAVLRPTHQGLPGGTAEVLLRRGISGSDQAIDVPESEGVPPRQTLVIDPDAVIGGIQWLRAGRMNFGPEAAVPEAPAR